MLNGDVGRIWTDHGGKGVPDESMAMVDTVNMSNVLVTGSLADRAVGDVLLSEQEFVGLQNGGVHGRAEL